VKPDDLLIHDERTAEPSLAFLLSRLRYPDFPEPLGVFRAVEQETYDHNVRQQNVDAMAKKGLGDLQGLLNGDETWTVE
jgi:2-oxoglutarate ferredoxin oxidoreductase subunit beta